jgi:small subunit ribosomal protein S15
VNTDKSQVAQFQRHDTDCGSMEVQVAQLQARVSQLTEHLKENRKDHSSRRALLTVLGRRNRFLKYMYDNDRPKYFEIISPLPIRAKNKEENAEEA